jgi:hypothetical protein
LNLKAEPLMCPSPPRPPGYISPPWFVDLREITAMEYPKSVLAAALGAFVDLADLVVNEPEAVVKSSLPDFFALNPINNMRVVGDRTGEGGRARQRPNTKGGG